MTNKTERRSGTINEAKDEEATNIGEVTIELIK
jgi:hypothetical protein